MSGGGDGGTDPDGFESEKGGTEVVDLGTGGGVGAGEVGGGDGGVVCFADSFGGILPL